MKLYEKYRPKSYSEVVGQDRAVAEVDCIRKSEGLQGQVFWIAAPSGVGKTSLARLIADEVAGDFDYIEIDGADLTMDCVRQYQESCRMKPLGNGVHTFLINEAHRLKSNVICRLNTAFESPEVARNSTWIFTTTIDGEARIFDGEIEEGPFLSRAQTLTMNRQGLSKPFAERAQQIARAEGLDGQPIEAYIKLAQKHKNNLRGMLNEIGRGCMLAK